MSRGLTSMGLSMNERRSDNKFRLRAAVVKGDVRTVSACSRLLGLSRSTILVYLRELDISIVDDTVMKMTKGSHIYHIDS